MVYLKEIYFNDIFQIRYISKSIKSYKYSTILKIFIFFYIFIRIKFLNVYLHFFLLFYFLIFLYFISLLDIWTDLIFFNIFSDCILK